MQKRNEFVDPIFGNKASFEELMWQRRQAAGNTMFDLTDPRFVPQTYRSRD